MHVRRFLLVIFSIFSSSSHLISGAKSALIAMGRYTFSLTYFASGPAIGLVSFDGHHPITWRLRAWRGVYWPCDRRGHRRLEAGGR